MFLERTQAQKDAATPDLSLQASIDYISGMPLPNDPADPAVSDYMIVPPATKPKKTLKDFYAYKHITAKNKDDHEKRGKQPTPHDIFSK